MRFVNNEKQKQDTFVRKKMKQKNPEANNSIEELYYTRVSGYH